LRVEYRDEVLRQLAEEFDFAPGTLSRDVVKSYRKKIQLIAAAKDEGDLYALRCLRLEKSQGVGQGNSSIRLDGQFRLVLAFVTDIDRVAVILEIAD
jgi:toxin HigB-1